ncbi:MAG: polysaccharide deacetylase family protein [Flavisolibacter sp.]|nr:polysaccharide deacetylase family protein [Flavisolibacter sp.]
MKNLLLYLFLFFAHSSTGQVLKNKIPDRLVVLTFDDGVKTHYSFVAPLLQQYHFGATFFVCEFPPDFSDTTKYMTWTQMQQLSKMGFEVANHTHTHRHVNKMTKEEFINELAYIEHKCDSLHIDRPKTFAYPGYDTHPVALEVLQEKGYLFARAGGNRVYDPQTDHPYLIPSFTTLKNNRQEIMEALTQAKNGKVVVLTIHGVPDIAHDWVTTPPDLFKEYLQYLYTHHYKVISLKDLSRYINVQKALRTIEPNLQKQTK